MAECVRVRVLVGEPLKEALRQALPLLLLQAEPEGDWLLPPEAEGL